jgi:hypothetical protein
VRDVLRKSGVQYSEAVDTVISESASITASPRTAVQADSDARGRQPDRSNIAIPTKVSDFLREPTRSGLPGAKGSLLPQWARA